MTATAPLPNGSNGGGDRDPASGRFVHGNAGGPGNPYARETARLRQLIREAVTDDDLREIVQALVSAAKGGDLAAAKEVLNCVVGKPLDIADDDAAARGALLRSEFAAGCSSMTPDPARAEEMMRHRADLRRLLIKDINGGSAGESGVNGRKGNET